MTLTITATGNAGVHVSAPGAAIFIDAFWDAAPRLLGGRPYKSDPQLAADLILVTHGHWDHFSADRVAEAAARTGARVIGPAHVVRELKGRVADRSVVEMEPPESPRGSPAGRVSAEIGAVHVTAFRTHHSRGHNSYLVKIGRYAIFHDGDNEDTRPLDAASLAPIDALFLCPWKGSGWADFVERLAPRWWFLIHMDDDEIAEQEAGRFLPGLADRVPLADRTLALRPGQAYNLSEPGERKSAKP